MKVSNCSAFLVGGFSYFGNYNIIFIMNLEVTSIFSNKGAIVYMEEHNSLNIS